MIELWLSSKSDAFGERHEIESFNRILSDSLLSLWSDRAQKLKQTQTYWNYQHKVEIKYLKTSQNKPNQAIVEANVQEIAKSYKNGQLGRSYNDNLRVRYDLIREKDRWLIQDIQVVQ
ncbi:ARC6/PARC6 family protein [Aphanothece sacrum]|uniref:ARC6/PARC6 family protein n=1 Tax=Aphanothece sacrum TaxID=1122 RepID=UPI000FFAB49A|nr:ARC6/PARC6 family protein [Aphanothece sacrum]GBF84821.1 molecular chaperone DnaJ [Aphanothece sacrum FPU3]